jgi:hypothetical protein
LAPGLSAYVGFVIKPFSVAVQFHAVPSAAASAAGAGGLKTRLLTGGLVACVRLDLPIPKLAAVLPICVLGELGQFQALGNEPGPAEGFFGGAGGRLGVEIPLGSGFYINAAADLLWTLQSSLVTSSVLFLPSMAPGAVRGAAGGGSVGVGYAW